MFATDGVTDYVAAEDFLPERFTSRADVADLLLRQATETSNQPTILPLMRQEALSK